MTRYLAWRLLVHEKARSAIAILGILFAILLIFMQLGFYWSVPNGGLVFYDALRFDLMLTSSAYDFQAQSPPIPRRRLYQALALDGVASAAGVYQDVGRWLNPADGTARDVFVIGFDPSEQIYALPEVDRQREILRRPDTILADTGSNPELGPMTVGRTVEIDERAVSIGGTYRLGPGFIALGAAVTSDLNFVRIFPAQQLNEINLGLLTLKPGADPDRVAAQLRARMPADTRVFTRQEIIDHESSHWLMRTPAGLIFGFGVAVAVVVGLVILNQTLSTQITRQLPQYATLKAMGYTDRDLRQVVLTLAGLLSAIAYVPAVGLALALYSAVGRMTVLPMTMTAGRLVSVLALALGMSAVSALLAIRVLRRADPADLF